ncbi:hypothetical protein WN51_06778 [Melipona quadrifasciata]|uniref:Uncharacterized protein n=1 Tax=Melipona quadrifasciata TaxID=166423 RepID=A0A0M8ZR06_9HYME|nr:hypothetical protein WN51_06778 [Melipona quadrifasciata]
MHKQPRKNPNNNIHSERTRAAKNPINIILWNATSVENMISELHKFLRQDPPPSNKPSAGILTDIHKDIPTEDTTQPATTNIEALIIMIKTPPKLMSALNFPIFPWHEKPSRLSWNVSPENLGHMATLSSKQETNKALDRGLMHGTNFPEHVRSTGQRDDSGRQGVSGPSCPTLDPRFSEAEGRGTEETRSQKTEFRNEADCYDKVTKVAGEFLLRYVCEYEE